MNMREKIARAVYDKATRFDGDPIGVHLGNSMMIDGSAKDAAHLKRIVMQVCEDAADAVLDALMEPTEEMISAADEAMRHRVVTGSARIETLKVGLLAMIRAAKEGK